MFLYHKQNIQYNSIKCQNKDIWKNQTFVSEPYNCQSIHDDYCAMLYALSFLLGQRETVNIFIFWSVFNRGGDPCE